MQNDISIGTFLGNSSQKWNRTKLSTVSSVSSQKKSDPITVYARVSAAPVSAPVPSSSSLPSLQSSSDSESNGTGDGRQDQIRILGDIHSLSSMDILRREWGTAVVIKDMIKLGSLLKEYDMGIVCLLELAEEEYWCPEYYPLSQLCWYLKKTFSICMKQGNTFALWTRH